MSHPQGQIESAVGRRSGPECELRGLVRGLLAADAPSAKAEALVAEICHRWPDARAMRAASEIELSLLPGMTERRLRRWTSAFALARRAYSEAPPKRPRLDSSRAVFDFLQEELRELEVEVFEVLSLDAKNRLRRRDRVSRGTLTGSLVHPREVFRPAITARAAAIVVVHNHPSGDPEPSAEDCRITDRLMAAGEILGIRVLDHVIVGEGRYVSLVDSGALLGAPISRKNTHD